MLVDELNRNGDDGGGDSGSPESDATVNYAENFIRALEEFLAPLLNGNSVSDQVTVSDTTIKTSEQ